MTTATEPSAPALEQIKADFDDVVARLDTVSPALVNWGDEIKNNLMPLLGSLLEHQIEFEAEVEAELDELSEGIDEVIDKTGDFLQEDSAQKLIGVLQAGAMLGQLLKQSIVKMDPAQRKQASQMIASHAAAVAEVIEFIREITIAAHAPGDEGNQDNQDANELAALAGTSFPADKPAANDVTEGNA